MATAEITHDTVLDAGSLSARLARVYAEALLSAALKESPASVEELGTELTEFVAAVSANTDVFAFLASPAVGKKAKLAVLTPALAGHASHLFRGLVSVLAANNRLDLLRYVAAAYNQILDQRAGRVPVKITAAVPLNDEQKQSLVKHLRNILRQEPVLNVRVEPDLLGGLVVQVGDTVIDTSVRARLQSLRTLLLAR